MFQRPRILDLWLMFSEEKRFRILAHVFRGLGFWGLAHVFKGPKVLNPGSYFQRTKSFGVLAHVFREPKVPDPGSCFQTPRILGLGSCFRGPRVLGLWLKFSEDQRF